MSKPLICETINCGNELSERSQLTVYVVELADGKLVLYRSRQGSG